MTHKDTTSATHLSPSGGSVFSFASSEKPKLRFIQKKEQKRFDIISPGIFSELKKVTPTSKKKLTTFWSPSKT